MDNKIYIALNDNVFVKEIKEETIQGSMILPDSLDNDFIKGEVISCSEGFFSTTGFVPSFVANGDIILFPKVSGVKVNLNGMPLIRVKQYDIVAKQVIGMIEDDKKEN